MKALLTRPQGKNVALAELLQRAGIQSHCEPLMSISALSLTQDEIRVAQQAEIVIFISVNAVQYAPSSLFATISSSTHVYAIGSATQQYLAEKGLMAQCPPEGSQHSEGLLALPSLSNIKGKQLLIVRGQGGREHLAEQARLRGARIRYAEVYQRIVPELDGGKCIDNWLSHGIDTIIVTSGEILTNLLTLMLNTDSDWLKHCLLIVVSARIEALAKAEGFTKVVNAGGASDHALLNTCKSLLQGSKDGINSN